MPSRERWRIRMAARPAAPTTGVCIGLNGSANLFTLVSDTFPTRAVGSVVGIGGMAGAIGGMLMAKYAGYVLEEIGSFLPLFILASSAYLIALLLIHVLMPKLAPADVG